MYAHVLRLPYAAYHTTVGHLGWRSEQDIQHDNYHRASDDDLQKDVHKRAWHTATPPNLVATGRRHFSYGANCYVS
jgi:hypothetical protein